MIRRAEAGDAAAIAHVHRSSRAEAYQHLGPRRQITVAHWESNLRGDVATWVFDAGAVVGFTSVDGPILAALYILPGVQGTGVGTALLAHAAGEGARQLWVYEDHPRARGFYEGAGWTVIPGSRETGADWQPRAPALRYELR